MARPKMRKAPKDLSNVSQIDWARLAAFIDGEGHIAINARKGRTTRHAYIRVIVTNTDPRLISWLLNHFGGSVMTQTHSNGNHRRTYKWGTSCRQAETILKGVHPYLIIKTAQADIALAFQETMRFHRGTPIPESVAQLRDQYRDQLLETRRIPHGEIHRDDDGNVTEFTH